MDLQLYFLSHLDVIVRFTPDSVRVGDYYLDDVDMSEQDIPVKRVILHENWDEVSM